MAPELVIRDAQRRGVEVSEVQDLGDGITTAFVDDPDGNSWAVQHIAPGAGLPR
jgi:hypothetical protein